MRRRRSRSRRRTRNRKRQSRSRTRSRSRRRSRSRSRSRRSRRRTTRRRSRRRGGRRRRKSRRRAIDPITAGAAGFAASSLSLYIASLFRNPIEAPSKKNKRNRKVAPQKREETTRDRKKTSGVPNVPNHMIPPPFSAPVGSSAQPRSVKDAFVAELKKTLEERQLKQRENMKLMCLDKNENLLGDLAGDVEKTCKSYYDLK